MLLQLDQQNHVVKLRPRLTAVKYSRGQPHDWKAKLLKKPGEQLIELVAETTPPTQNDFVVKRRQGEDNWAAQKDIQILKGDSKHVRAVEPLQGFGRGLARSFITNALEIRVYLHKTHLSVTPPLAFSSAARENTNTFGGETGSTTMIVTGEWALISQVGRMTCWAVLCGEWNGPASCRPALSQ
jgi:hypothetical protein